MKNWNREVLVSDQFDRLKSALADRYVLESELGAGGNANVYLARDLKHDRPVAIKVLKPELAAIIGPERFLREIQITANLRHPHILPLLNSGEADGFLYYVMPVVDGESLRDRLNREKQLPVDDVIKIAREVADALYSAHNHNVIHRDIKPENILLQDGHAVVTDFGIGRAIESAGDDKLTETGLSVGTAAYMSPEQASASADIDARTDIYSLACVVYEMLAGEPPYTGPTSQSVIAKSLIDPVPSVRRLRDAVPPAVDAALTRALAKVPVDRFTDAAEFAEALSATAAPDVTPRAAKRVLLVAAASLVLIVATLTLGWSRFSTLLGRNDNPVVGEKAWTLVADADGNASEEIRNVVRGLVSAAIDASAILRTLPDGQIRQGLSLAGMPDTTTWLDLQAASELAFRGSVRTVVAPTIDQIGRTFAMTVRVVDAETGDVIAVAQGNASGEDELIAGLDEVVQRLRRDLGERPQDIQSTRRLPRVMTPSYDAYGLYVRAGRLFAGGDLVGAIALYKEALGYDPDFAAAMLKIATNYGNLGESDSSSVWEQKAAEHPERLTEFQTLNLESKTAANPAETLRIRERMVREFHSGHNNYALSLSAFGRYAEANAVMEERDALPFAGGLSSLFVYNRALWLLPVGRFDEARGFAQQLTGELADNMNARIAAAEANWALAESSALSLLERPSLQYRFFYREGVVIVVSAQAARGRIHEAIDVLDQRTRLAVQQGDDASANVFRGARLLLAVASNEQVDSAPHPTVASDTTVAGQQLAALWAAWAGDTVPAMSWLRSTDTGQDSLVGGIDRAQSRRLLLQARVAAASGRSDQVIELLEPVTVSTFTRMANAPYNQLARWTIAEAYEQIDDLESAAAYFGLIASYDGFSDFDPPYRGLVHSFAHRRLAMIYTRLEDVDRAKEHWQTFLDNFIDPDPDVQWMIDEARAELEGLGRKAPPDD